MSAEQTLKDKGIVLPVMITPQANYIPTVRTGNLLFVSGQGPEYSEEHCSTGKVGAEIDVETAYRDARQAGLNMLAAVRQALGSLDRVSRVVKLLGMVNAVPEFTEHPEVINGCSDLLVEVFGERGKHARAAVGFSSLPFNQTVEIEAIFEIRADD